VAAEFVATTLLLAAIVGSGIMAEALAGGNVAIALLANSVATGASLVALIVTFGPTSGAHMNPAVTLSELLLRRIDARVAVAYVGAQLVGALAGVALAHGMFERPVFFASSHVRSGSAQLLSEFVATFGLLAVVQGASHRTKASLAPFAVGGYITAAYWFTASTSFANPVVTLARAATDTFKGIRPADVPAFVVVQLLGAYAATVLLRWMMPQFGEGGAERRDVAVPQVASHVRALSEERPS
jgi:glycerol uptake facilitator-like aquaporin